MTLLDLFARYERETLVGATKNTRAKFLMAIRELGLIVGHAIRRSVASHAALAGADASALLDHSDASITRKYYIDRRIVPAPRAIDFLFRPGT